MASIALALALVIGLGGGLISVAAHAEDKAVPETQKPDKSKRVCKTIVPTGSRFGTRTCRTQEDWDRDREASQRFLEDGQVNHSARDEPSPR